MNNCLLGYQKGVSKKTGKPYCRFYVSSDLTGFDKESGFVGVKVEEKFLPADQVDLFNPSCIGKELHLDYALSGNYAFLTNVSVVNK